MIIPIGHEDLSVRRLPWVTIGIALVCVAVQVKACSVEAESEAAEERIRGEISRVFQEVAVGCARTQACPAEAIGARGLAKALRARQIGTAEQQERLAALEAEHQALFAAHPVSRFGYRPSTGGILRLFTNVFTHGGWEHLLGNMLFLYLVGTTIEDRWGRWRFLLFYLLGGVVATLTYALVHHGSDVPLVGASGAIAAAMGAFAVQFLKTRVRFFYVWWMLILRWGTFSAPAWVVLPLWFLEQLFFLAFERGEGGGVGYSAHVGGFVFGAAVSLGVRLAGLDKRFDEEVDKAAGGWSEDPLYVEAERLAGLGQDRAALSRLSELLAKSPNHRPARELAFQSAAKARVAPAMVRHGAALFPEWLKTEPERVLAGYHHIIACAEVADDERILQLAMSAAAAQGDLATAEDVLRRMFRSFPNSAHVPRVLFTAAELYAARDRASLATRCLEKLVAEHPASPFAERARAWLEGAA